MRQNLAISIHWIQSVKAHMYAIWTVEYNCYCDFILKLYNYWNGVISIIAKCNTCVNGIGQYKRMMMIHTKHSRLPWINKFAKLLWIGSGYVYSHTISLLEVSINFKRKYLISICIIDQRYTYACLIWSRYNNSRLLKLIDAAAIQYTLYVII